MKAIHNTAKSRVIVFMMFLISIGISTAQTQIKTIKGTVIGEDSRKPLESAIVSLMAANISTVTNAEGKFILKIEDNIDAKTVMVSHPGYKNKAVDIGLFAVEDFEIVLNENPTQLNIVALTTFKQAENLVKEVFKKKAENNQNLSVMMTAFYRETIKRRRTNVSLTEAVVNLYKKPYLSNAKDEIELQIARKSTNYKKFDTLAVKLKGGPFTTVYLDIMKYPEYIFTNETIPEYDFSFDSPSSINNRPVYVVNFKQKETVAALRYQGQLFIDAESLALASANYSLYLDGKASARDFLTAKKPRDVIVYPTEALYKVNYREKDGRWFYGYGKVDLTFKVNKKRKLFNQVYTVSSEMAITDWDIYDAENHKKSKERLRPSMILADRISGFSNPNFWGRYNLIEPEKSIESAIEKIKKQMRKNAEKAEDSEKGKP